MQPILLLRILWRDAGLSKQHVAGSLAAINMMIASLGTIIFPTVGSALYAHFGAPNLCTMISAALVVVYVPVAFLLIPYAETPECFKPRSKERRHTHHDAAGGNGGDGGNGGGMDEMPM